jgi:hypothetical protein
VAVSPGGWVRRQLCELLSALFQVVAHISLTVSWLLLQALFNAVSWGEPSHPPTPAGFVYLEFSWALAPPLNSHVESYQPPTVAVLVYLEFAWGTALLPLSGGVCACQPLLPAFPIPNSLGGASKPTFSSRLVYLQFTRVPAPLPFSRV